MAHPSDNLGDYKKVVEDLKIFEGNMKKLYMQ